MDDLDIKCSLQGSFVCLSTIGITLSWKVAGYLCMPSPSRSLKTIPGTVATSGQSSLLKICKSIRNGLLRPVQVYIHKALIYIQGRRYGQPPPASTGLQWKEVFCVRKDPLWGLECIQFFCAVEILPFFSCDLPISFLSLRAWSTARNVTVRS